MTKTEFRELIALRLRDPKTKPKEFILLAELYGTPVTRRNKKREKGPGTEEINEMVLKLEKESANG